MPCSDYDTSGHSIEYRDKPETIRNLCEAYSIIESKGLLHLVNSKGQTWWKAHQREDKARKEAEALRLTKEKKRQAVLAKLSNEDKRILGLK